MMTLVTGVGCSIDSQLATLTKGQSAITEK